MPKGDLSISSLNWHDWIATLQLHTKQKRNYSHAQSPLLNRGNVFVFDNESRSSGYHSQF